MIHVIEDRYKLEKETIMKSMVYSMLQNAPGFIKHGSSLELPAIDSTKEEQMIWLEDEKREFEAGRAYFRELREIALKEQKVRYEAKWSTKFKRLLRLE